MSAFSLSRRGVAGFLGLAAAFPASAAPVGPDAALAAVLDRLREAERVFEGLPDDDPASDALIVAIDRMLISAAMFRQVSDRGFAIKAAIANQHRDSAAGQIVARMLISDLMIRGRMPERPPTEAEFLALFRAQTPDRQAAFVRFARDYVAGRPFEDGLAQLVREMPPPVPLG